ATVRQQRRGTQERCDVAAATDEEAGVLVEDVRHADLAGGGAGAYLLLGDLLLRCLADALVDGFACTRIEEHDGFLVCWCCSYFPINSSIDSSGPTYSSGSYT